MQFKLVPEAPEDLAFVADVQRGVPLVPGTENDCCARIMRRVDIPSRDEARTWLTFLRALELAREGQSGFHRRRREPEIEELRAAFRERVYGVERVLEILEAAEDGDDDEDGEPLSADDVYERFRDHVPQYERHKHADRTDEIWRERVERILEWATLLDLAERTGDGYVRA